MLYSIGYDDFVARDENPNWNDGKYGISTELAVQAFQQDEDLNVNGTVDMKTLNKIMEKIK
jgi:peptidoglycan hydrolase-like protein with peptidoglycan-binding domain